METETNSDGGGSGTSDYRQLGVLREFGNIGNAVSDEEFLSVMKNIPKFHRVKWRPITKCLRERVQQDMADDWSGMWQEENVSQKLEILEKQKEKYLNDSKLQSSSWRPKLGDVKAQLISIDVSILRRKKLHIESQAKEYENRVAKLKKTIIPKRGYLRAIQIEMQKCQKKNEEISKTLGGTFEKHSENGPEIYPVNKDFECEIDECSEN